MAQQIHDHRSTSDAKVERIAAAGEILVVARLVRLEPVVRLVVDPAEAERPPQVIALGGVVVDDIEDHLDPGVVQPLDRLAKFIERSVARSAVEEIQRVVAPIVAQAARRQERLVDERVDWKQLDRGDAKPPEMIDHRRCAQRAKCAAQLRRNVLPQLGQAFDMGLVDDGVFPGDQAAIARSANGLVDTTAFGITARVVAAVERQIPARAVRGSQSASRSRQFSPRAASHRDRAAACSD